MKKIGFSIGTALILLIGVIVLLDFNKQNNSYSTPTEALNNVKSPKLEVFEVIETRFFEHRSVSYVFFYSEADQPQNYLGVARFHKNKYGWKFTNMSGVGRIERNNVGGYIGRDDFHVGIIPSYVAKVQLGGHEANILRLRNGMKAWFFHGLSSEEFEEHELRFIDEKGKLL